MEEEITKGNDERITRHNQRIVEASEDAAHMHESHQDDQGREQPHGQRSRTEASGGMGNRDGDKGATISQDPEGIRHSRKRSGGMDEEAERLEKVRQDHSRNEEGDEDMADIKRGNSGELEWAKRSRTDEKEEMGIIGDVRLGMTTAEECRIAVEDMALRGIIVSITASKEGCEWGEDAKADIIMDQVQRHKGYIHEMGDNGLSDQLRWTMQKGGPMYVLRWGSLNWVAHIREVAEEAHEARREKGECVWRNLSSKVLTDT
jgi:hypothetical protein